MRTYYSRKDSPVFPRNSETEGTKLKGYCIDDFHRHTDIQMKIGINSYIDLVDTASQSSVKIALKKSL